MAAKILYFSTGWCSPCKIMYPIIEALAKEHNVELVKINAEEDLEHVSEYNIMSVPAIIFIKDEKESSRILGFSNKDKMTEKLKQIL